MSGHNKWSQIKYQKATADLRRGKVFSKIAGAIAAAVKVGGSDICANIRLRLLLDQARHLNMPKENVSRAIQRGEGKLTGANIEEVLYEAYGPAGIAIIINVITDNRNRTTALIRSTLNKFGGRLAENGAVKYLFEQKGVLIINLESNQQINKDELILKIIDAGALDFVEDNSNLTVYTPPKELEQVKKNLEQSNIIIQEIKLSWEPKNMIEISDAQKATQILNFMDILDEIEEVNSIYSNFDIEDKILEGQYK